ncbi:hypothetical protein D9619_008420 [Psilocybe cf. subviscida]|uniref:Uncharacterized protein n=1 Tax=Psilocybe cf. subviscida TaxID=2480587 RepID=A0A8H5BA47_9AGAR|nr:hypothetical protein D9619_008420 [Psilocybe cf. subviscida]
MWHDTTQHEHYGYPPRATPPSLSQGDRDQLDLEDDSGAASAAQAEETPTPSHRVISPIPQSFILQLRLYTFTPGLSQAPRGIYGHPMQQVHARDLELLEGFAYNSYSSANAAA